LCLSFLLSTSSPLSEIATLSLHDALPILAASCRLPFGSPKRNLRFIRRFLPPTTRADPGLKFVLAPTPRPPAGTGGVRPAESAQDRKSTRLNSSHGSISYAVFCLTKKNIG